MSIIRPSTKKEKLNFLAVLVAAAGSFTGIGSAILMWEDLRPWMSNAEKLEQHERACQSMLWTIETDLWRAQEREISANDRKQRYAKIPLEERTEEILESMTLNKNILVQAKQAQQVFQRKLKRETEDCEEGRDKWD
jgi:hypothetical protein